MDLLDRLLDHDRWATAQLLGLSRELADAQLDQEFDIGVRTLRETLSHSIYYVGFWTEVMAGQSVSSPTQDRSPTALTERHARDFETFASFARRVRDKGCLEETFVDHFGERMTYGGGLLHVILHNAEHRSEAVHILHRLGVPDVPEIDHGLWDFVRRGY